MAEEDTTQQPLGRKNGAEPEGAHPEFEILDLDGLILEPPRILLPGGVAVELKDLTRDEMIEFLRQVDEIETGDEARKALAYADLIASIAVTPDAAEKLEAMTLAHVVMAMQWIRAANAVTFDASQVAPIGQVKLDGKLHDVWPLTVGDYRELMQREGGEEDEGQPEAGEESLVDAFHRNAASWTVMLRDVAPERLEQMTQWTRGKLATYMGQVQLRAMQKLFDQQRAASEAALTDGAGANPTSATTQNRRDRRAARSRGRRRG